MHKSKKGVRGDVAFNKKREKIWLPGQTFEDLASRPAFFEDLASRPATSLCLQKNSRPLLGTQKIVLLATIGPTEERDASASITTGRHAVHGRPGNPGKNKGMGRIPAASTIIGR
jgi:hypothetical protein